MKHAEMIKIAKGLDTFFKVMQRFCTIAIAVMLILMVTLTIVHVVNPDAVIGEGFASLDIGPLTLGLAESHTPTNATVLKTAWVMVVFGSLSAAVMAYAFGQLRALMVPLKEGNPFCEAVCTALKELSRCAIVMGVVGNIGAAVETAVTMHLYDLTNLAPGGAITSLTANHELSLDFLMVYFLLLLVRYIFRYGMQLQQLSDETL